MTSKKKKKIERTQLIPFRFCSQACKCFVIENQPHWQNGKKLHLRTQEAYWLQNVFANQYLMQNMPISEKHCS